MRSGNTIYIVLAASLLFNVVFLLAGIMNTVLKTEIHKSCQPEGLVYDGDGPYCVSILKPTLGGSYEIRFTQAIDRSNEHVIAFNVSNIDLNEEMNSLEWWNRGVFIHLDTGHEVFIPKEAFVSSTTEE